MRRTYVEAQDRMFEGRKMEPDTILPAQFFDRPAEATTGEHRLLIALLEDAIRVYRHQTVPRGRTFRSRWDIRAAEAWFDADDFECPFSFVNVCDFLGLDALTIRRRLLETRGRAVTLSAVPIPDTDPRPKRCAAGG